MTPNKQPATAILKFCFNIAAELPIKATKDATIKIGARA